MPAIDKANDCDLKYRGSKNQRLLVELTLMQIASINFDGAKKKSSNYIIPATFFTSLSPSIKKKVSEPAAKTLVKSQVETEIKSKVKVPLVNVVTESTKPLLKNIKRRTSALSLKSIHQKKEIKGSLDEDENFENHPRTAFTHEELKDAWKKYYFKLQELGERSIAAILASGEPQLGKAHSIIFSLPNDLMKTQLERGKPKLIGFLREKLNNYGIQIEVVVNQTVEKKFAYTPKEKYEKLKEKNPLIQKLKITFGLDL
jgi:DNA polymerase-3 subunit gamma/tau